MLRNMPLSSSLWRTPAWKGAWRQMFSSQATSLGKPTRAPIRSTLRSELNRLPRLITPRPTLARPVYQKFAQSGTRRGFRLSAWRRSTGPNGEAVQPLSLRERLKKLTREYGWSVVGVYLALSVLDFPFCFLLVRVVGVETIGKVEHYVVSSVKSMIPESLRNRWNEYYGSVKQAEMQELGNDEISEKVEMIGWGVQQAEERNKEEASIWTQLALAYAIHKSFIFVRVPLTAAITPKVVRVLRSWGWNIGKRTPRK